MAQSFAAYASQFLNRQQNADSSLASSQPLFYSFSSSDDEGDGRTRHHQHRGDVEDIPDADLDDLGNPYLRTSTATATEDMDDPYLRLDEEDQQLLSGNSRHAAQSVPLIQGGDSHRSGGWLAHQTVLRTPSPTSSSSSVDSQSPPPDLYLPPPRRQPASPLPPPPPRLSLSLTQSLLPRDGTSRPIDVFSLPDPHHTPRGRRRHNDALWTALWLYSLGLCVFFSILTLFVTHKPKRNVQLPYTTLLHTVPMLTILTFVSAGVAYAHIFLLRIFVRPVMLATSVFIPATLFISSLWAFIGSFMWDGDMEPTWGETIGLRLFALVPLVLSLLTARRLLDLPREIHTASALLDLTTRILVQHPFLLALSPSILLAALLFSLPFLTLIFRLLLIGYPIAGPPNGALEWHLHAWAHWAIAAVCCVWLWSWAVARGVLRVSTAGVVGAWYWTDHDTLPPAPPQTHTLHAALVRATGSSLGTIALGGLILTAIRVLTLSASAFRMLPRYLPLVMRPYATVVSTGAVWAINWLENWTKTSTLSTHALVYTGLTGDAFMPAAGRARELTAAVEGTGVGRYKKKFKTEPPLTLLTVAPLTLSFPFALATYLFVAHTLGAPAQALGASVMSAGITALVGLFCVGLVKDTSDTLYLCYCIDKDSGGRRHEDVFQAFEYEAPRAPAPSDQMSLPLPATTPQARTRQVPLERQPLKPDYLEEEEEDEPSSPDFRAVSPPRGALAQAAQADSALNVHATSHLMDSEALESSQSAYPVGVGSVAGTHRSDSGRSKEVEESQLFPGSDLF